MIYLFLANGFEEIEALAPVDILRRAGEQVRTVGVGGRTITGSHGIPVDCDCTTDALPDDTPDAVILPGGMPGTKNLDASETVRKTTLAVHAAGGLVCAICAAPSVPGHLGILRDKRATCFPGFEGELTGAVICEQSVVRDGNIITARGAGVALDFGFEIVAALCGGDKAALLHSQMQCR